MADVQRVADSGKNELKPALMKLVLDYEGPPAEIVIRCEGARGQITRAQLGNGENAPPDVNQAGRVGHVEQSAAVLADERCVPTKGPTEGNDRKLSLIWLAFFLGAIAVSGWFEVVRELMGVLVALQGCSPQSIALLAWHAAVARFETSRLLPEIRDALRRFFAALITR